MHTNSLQGPIPAPVTAAGKVRVKVTPVQGLLIELASELSSS